MHLLKILKKLLPIVDGSPPVIQISDISLFLIISKISFACLIYQVESLFFWWLRTHYATAVTIFSNK